jgi:hypothetical protein
MARYSILSRLALLLLSAAILSQSSVFAEKSRSKTGGATSESEWKSQDLSLLGVGMAVGDVDGDGDNEIVLIDPTTVYLYKLTAGKLGLVAEYPAGALDLKSVDVAKVRPQGPARIYVSAQNRGNVASFALEFRSGKLVPVITDITYFLRVINYPTKGPFLLGQKKALDRMYAGPIYRMEDKGNELEERGPFGVPLRIPIFGFAIGDLAGNRTPLIAVYDRTDHLRVYNGDKRLFVTQDYFGGSDVLLRWAGPEQRKSESVVDSDDRIEFFRPRIQCLDNYGSGSHQVLAICHTSTTRRLLSRSKMLEEGQVVGLSWNGEVLEDAWATPKVQGMVVDFAVGAMPGMKGQKLVVFERKKTDWLAFLRSQSIVRIYDLDAVIQAAEKRVK